MGDLMQSRIDGEFRIECEIRGLNPNTATLYDLLVKVRDAAHSELKQIADTPPPAPDDAELMIHNTGWRNGYNAAHSEFAKLCTASGLNPAETMLADLLEAHVKAALSLQSSPEVNAFHYSRGLEDGKHEAALEREHRKPSIVGPGVTIHHVGPMKLTVIVGGNGEVSER